ncbi:hypothetical protein FACS1894190_09740 [Spirochaetia bacterium]|nr:hypothetical protein FACS1894190_09740 [Spirochaetia bacterium]GHV19240.1 hypothetical protein FACS189494_00290 [Spirochaetia bacterium]
MKKLIFLLFFLQLSYVWSLSDADLLKKVDSLASYYGTDFSAEYRILQEKPGQVPSETVANVFRRDSNAIYTIVILEPVASRGEGYIKQGDTLWLYDAGSKKFKSTSSQDRFQNSNARNSDFTRSTLAEDYEIVIAEDAKLGKTSCRVLTLESITTDVTYPRMKVWITAEGLILKSEDYSLSGQLLRTSAMPEYRKIENRYVPKTIIFIDALRGTTINGKFVSEKTTISIDKVKFGKLPDSTFSKQFLETVSN